MVELLDVREEEKENQKDEIAETEHVYAKRRILRRNAALLVSDDENASPLRESPGSETGGEVSSEDSRSQAEDVKSDASAFEEEDGDASEEGNEEGESEGDRVRESPLTKRVYRSLSSLAYADCSFRATRRIFTGRRSVY